MHKELFHCVNKYYKFWKYIEKITNFNIRINIYLVHIPVGHLVLALRSRVWMVRELDEDKSMTLSALDFVERLMADGDSNENCLWERGKKKICIYNKINKCREKISFPWNYNFFFFKL